jgi:HEAT repeat protein
MKPLKATRTLLFVHFVCGLAAVAGEAKVDDLIKELEGEGEAVKRSAGEWEAAHAKILTTLLPKFGSENLDERQDAQRAYERICWRASRPGADAERAAACTAMVAALKPELPKPSLLFLLQELERIGREEAVEALARFLDSEDLEQPTIRESARRALLTNPSPKAVEALRAAVGRAEDPLWRVGLINALAARRDRASVPAFIKLAQDKGQDQVVRSAALEGLGAIGDKEAASVIAGATKGVTGRPWRVAIVSYLLLADRLVEQGDKAGALKLYSNLLEAEEYVKCGAIIGVGRAGGTNELPTIFAALGDADAEIRGAAMTALDMMPVEAVRAAIVEKAKSASPGLKAVLLKVLASKGDKSVVPTFVAFAADPDEAVRIAACEGLAALGDEAAIPPLIAALGKAKDKELQAVQSALARVPGKAATDALVKAMAGAETGLGSQILRTLAARKDPVAIPALLKFAEDKEPAIRSEAFKALGSFAGEEALEPLVGLLVKADEKDRDAAEKAIAAVCGRIQDEEKRAAPLLAAFSKSEGPVKGALLRVLGRLGGKKALEAVRAALKDANAEIKDAALRALAEWPDASVAADLLDAAKGTDNLAHHVLALRGCLRVLALPGERSADEKLKLLAGAMKAARRPDEKKEILGAMGTIVSLDALKQVEPFLADETLKAEAAIASVKIASGLAGAQPDAAKAALKKLLDAAPSDDVKRQAQEALNQLDKFEDYITAWEVAGPYTAQGKDGPALHDVAFPPEQADAKGVVWEVIPPGGGEKQFYPFHMDLVKKFGAKENVAAYLRTNVWSPEDQKAQLEFGSDDGAKVWLNGALVLNAGQPRSFAVAGDKVEVALKKGWNAILVKVWNGGGHWGAAARLRKADGSQLPGLRAAIKQE